MFLTFEPDDMMRESFNESSVRIWTIGHMYVSEADLIGYWIDGARREILSRNFPLIDKS